MAEYIKREDAISAFDDADPDVMADYGPEYGSEWGFSRERLDEVLQSVPAADVAEVRHGKWIWDPDGMDWGLGAWKCSECACRNNNLPINNKVNPLRFSGSKFCPQLRGSHG